MAALSARAIEEQAKRVSRNRRAAKDDPVREAANDALVVAQKKLARRGVRAKLALVPRGRATWVRVDLPLESLMRLLEITER